MSPSGFFAPTTHREFLTKYDRLMWLLPADKPTLYIRKKAKTNGKCIVRHLPECSSKRDRLVKLNRSFAGLADADRIKSYLLHGAY